MLKPMIAATTILAIAGFSTVSAQQFGEPGGDDGGPRFEQQYRPSADDIKAFTDARIAALRAGLQLTPDQETNWPPFEQAVRDLATQMSGGHPRPAESPDRSQFPLSAIPSLSLWVL